LNFEQLVHLFLVFHHGKTHFGVVDREHALGTYRVLVQRDRDRAHRAGLIPVLCVGETLEQREQGHMETVLGRQLSAVLEAAGVAALQNAVVAYEPVWAIGTGRNATPAQAQQAHEFIRATVARRDAGIASGLRMLYGGSVKAANAAELMAQPDVDGALVGGASLVAKDFAAIWRAAVSAL